MGSRSDIEHWRINATVYEDRVEEEHYITDPAKNIRQRPRKIVWRLGEILGSGGFGEVRLQKNEEGKARAVKQIAPSTYLRIGGWEKELKALLEFSKPKFKETGAFVELYGWFENSYGIFLATEYVPLGDLEKNVKARSGKIPENEARDIVTQILTGLEIMHRESFVHRDLKPQNILVVAGPAEWWVKIADFGLSKRLTETTTYNTRGGTTPYMAPELLDYFGSSSKYTYAIDLWAVGCIAYRLVTGKVPFSRNELQTYCRNESSFPSQNLLDNNVKTPGRAFIRRLLDKHSDRRPSASQALNDAWITSSVKIGKNLEHLSLSEQRSPVISTVTGSEGYNTASHLGLKTLQQPSFSNTNSPIKHSPRERPVPYTKLASNSNQSMINNVNDLRIQDFLSSQTTIKAIPYGVLKYSSVFDMLQGSTASSKKVKFVKTLFGDGADSNVVDEDGWTLLNAAATEGNAEVVRILLGNGAVSNVVDEDGRTPLDAAAAGGHIEVVKILLDNGAVSNVADKDGWTPLYAAARNGHAKIVKILLDNGAYSNMADKDGWTPLHAAADQGHIEVVKILLDNKANFNIANKYGWTPLHASARNGRVTVVNILLDNGADSNVVGNDGWTPLHAAADQGHVEIVKILLDDKTNFNEAATNGWTPLHVAAHHGHVEVVQILLNNGANFNMVNKDGRTPLDAAAARDHVKVVKILLDNGAYSNVVDKDGWTPLHAAADEGHVEVIQILLNNGADPNVADNAGWTPLHTAADQGHVQVVSILLEKGANPVTTDNKGRTPLYSAAVKGYVKIAKILLQKGAIFDSRTKAGWTALEVAARNRHTQVVRVLVDHRDSLRG